MDVGNVDLNHPCDRVRLKSFIPSSFRHIPFLVLCIIYVLSCFYDCHDLMRIIPAIIGT